MKTQHTPGPWKHYPGRDTILSEHPDYLHSVIAKIATGENREEENANAKLIAAAPELLEACKAALADESTAYAIAELCRKAIAKATT